MLLKLSHCRLFDTPPPPPYITVSLAAPRSVPHSGKPRQQQWQQPMQLQRIPVSRCRCSSSMLPGRPQPHLLPLTLPQRQGPTHWQHTFTHKQWRCGQLLPLKPHSSSSSLLWITLQQMSSQLHSLRR